MREFRIYLVRCVVDINCTTASLIKVAPLKVDVCFILEFHNMLFTDQ